MGGYPDDFITEQLQKALINLKWKQMKIRAKIQIGSAIKNEYGERVVAHGVYGGSTNAEDNTFSAATPSLHLDMNVSNPDVIGMLQQGKKYYIDFTEAPE